MQLQKQVQLIGVQDGMRSKRQKFENIAWNGGECIWESKRVKKKHPEMHRKVPVIKGFQSAGWWKQRDS